MSTEKVAGDYIDAMQRARERYGDRTLVLMQVGSFYEVYDTEDAETSHALGICERYLYLKVTLKKKLVVVVGDAKKPVYSAGIPLESLSRYKSMLMEKKFTVLLINQADDDTTHRRLHSIASPGFDEDVPNSAIATVLVAANQAHVAKYDSHINRIDVFDVAPDGVQDLIPELRTALTKSGLPSELKIFLEHDVADLPDRDLAAAFSGCALHIERLAGKRRYLYDRRWQRRSLETHYARFRAIGEDVIAKLGLQERSVLQTTALILLLGFVRDHDERAADTIPLPIVSEEGDDKQLRLLNSSMLRLNVFEAPQSTLMQVIGRNVRTAMGQRSLRARLAAPIADVPTLARRYDDLDVFRAFVRHDNGRMDGTLKKIKDLHRISCNMRKMRVRPCDMGRIVESFRLAATVLDDSPLSQDGAQRELDALKDMLEIAGSVFDDDDAGPDCFVKDASTRVSARVQTAFEWPSPQLESTRAAVEYHTRQIEAIQTKYDEELGATGTTRLVATNGLVRLATSLARGKTLSKKGHTIVSAKSHSYIEDAAVVSSLQTYAQARIELDEVCAALFQSAVESMNDVFFTLHGDAIAERIGHIDMLHGLAKRSLGAHYCRPTLVEAPTGQLKLTGMRHPIIEELVDESGHSYVRNDVSIAHSESMLLYGVNSAGKSLMLKAIACAVLMAQCGFFVAADTCVLAPYTAMSIHIGGTDDMYRSQSTFVREVEELRTVLRASRTEGATTLFLADELGNSTEDTSALKLMGALLHTLYTRKVTTILATHMFALQENMYVQGLRGLRNYHLRVDFEGDQIVFNRTLTPGLPPTREYGCRIAARLLVEDDCMTKHLNSDWHNQVERTVSRSRYNASSFADACSVCGYRPMAAHHRPIAWHHIHEQATAVDGILPDGRPLHSSCNLMAVCDACHGEIHRGNILVHGYEDTLEGPRLRFEKK